MTALESRILALLREIQGANALDGYLSVSEIKALLEDDGEYVGSPTVRDALDALAQQGKAERNGTQWRAA